MAWLVYCGGQPVAASLWLGGRCRDVRNEKVRAAMLASLPIKFGPELGPMHRGDGSMKTSLRTAR